MNGRHKDYVHGEILDKSPEQFGTTMDGHFSSHDLV